MKLLAILFFIVAVLSGCQLSPVLDRSYLNHPGMDMSQSATPNPKAVLTQLDQVFLGSASGGCSVCAK